MSYRPVRRARRRSSPRACSSSSPRAAAGSTSPCRTSSPRSRWPIELTDARRARRRRQHAGAAHGRRHPRRQHRRRRAWCATCATTSGVVITQPARCSILGAGGATRGVLGAAARPGAGGGRDRQPHARTAPRRSPRPSPIWARRRASASRTSAPSPFDLVINATSASLSGEIPPIPAAAIGPQTVCYDLAYGEAAHRFRAVGARAGCARALQGWGMLVEQAAESFRLWRGVRPATARVLAALRERAGGACSCALCSAHRDQLFGAGRMDRHRVVEVPLGGAHAHRHREALQHLVGARRRRRARRRCAARRPTVTSFMSTRGLRCGERVVHAARSSS